MNKRRGAWITQLVGGLVLAGCVHGPGSISAPASRDPSGTPPPARDSAVTLLGPVLPYPMFPSTNWWHTEVSTAPVDTGSARWIDWLNQRTPDAPNALCALHADFGAAPYGIPYCEVGGLQPLEVVTFLGFPTQSDPGIPGRPTGYPIPISARAQAGWIEGAVAGGGYVGDRRLIVVDRDNQYLYETRGTRWDPVTGHWEAASGAVWDLRASDPRAAGWPSADGSGLAIFPGLVKYDELGQDLTHALRVTVRASNGCVFPATRAMGSSPGAPPLGMRLRLKAAKDLSTYPLEMQRIFSAMKKYGVIVADEGSDLYVSGTMDPRWSTPELNAAFGSLSADDFEVIQLGWGQ